MSGRTTSVRALCALAVLVAGYLALAVVAGAPNSPLTVLLPAGVRPPGWATGLARISGLSRVGRHGLTGVSWILVLAVLAAYVGVLVEAWAGRIRLAAVLTAAGMSLAISVAAPLLLSRDVYTYAAYARIETLYHRDPYTTPLAAYPHDPFVAVASAQWRHTHSIYGPAFTLASAAIARTWAASPGGTMFAFKLATGLAIAAATGFAALAAARLRPGRAPLAAALVGLNPVLVIHTVGGGHVDALIAAPLAAAAAIAVTRPRRTSLGALAVTALLTVACLVKVVVVPALALWVVWLARTERTGRGRSLGRHAAVIVGLTLASLAPFVAGWRTLAPLATPGGVEAWASPSHFVGSAADALAGSLAGPGAGSVAARAVEVGFLLLFLVLLWRLAGGVQASDPAAWGIALLLLALSMPFLLPWYAAWFVPLLALVADRAVLLAGALASCVLALTLIPADPFHGYSAPAVMDGVHYGAAPVLLVVLAVVAARIPGRRQLEPAGP